MQCTPREIEEKRRQAQLKLSQKNLISNINTTNSNLVNFGNSSTNSNKSPFRFKNPTSPRISTPERFSSPIKTANGYPSNVARTGAAFSSKPYDKPKQALNFYGKNNVTTGACALISEERFVVELSGYNTAAIDVFKTIPSKSYNSKTRQWDFKLSDYELVQNKLSYLQPDVVVGKLPNYVLQCCRMPKPRYSTIDLSGIDRELCGALMPFQEEGVCFGIDKNGRCLIADDMGLGKTFQALAIANYYRSDWPVLIATTASMKNVWEETIYKFIPSVSVMHTQSMISGKDYIGDAQILIVSHDIMSRSLQKLLKHKFGVLIVDESHTLKNFKAKCTKAATALASEAKRVILLSGTPALSRPSELYAQLSLIDEKFFGNFFEYSKRYCDGKTTHFGWDASGKSNLQELEIILAKRFMIRRTKEDVLKSLPNKEQEVVTLDVNLNHFSEADRKCLNALADNYNRQKKGTEKHAALLTFFAETAKIKIPSVCSYILQILEEHKKFIVFAHHQKMLNAIAQVLNKKQIQFIRIDGSTTSNQRKYFVDKFQLDDNYQCGILSITAANAGITLTAAKLVLFAELHWNPSILSQAESRAHRIGQEGKVLVKYLLAPGTADDSIWPLLQNKQKILKEAGLFKDSFENVAVTKQDLSNSESIANCLHSNITSASTLDITTYFKSPSKNNTVHQGESNNKENCDNNPNKSVPEDITIDVFDDEFVDVLDTDITTYFRSPSKNNSANQTEPTDKENCFENTNKSTSEDVINDIFDDGFDDMLATDITTYFKSPCTENNEIQSESANKGSCVRDVNKSRSENVVNNFFDDGFDDVLSNVELNI